MYAALAALAYAMALQAEVRRRAVSEAQLEASLAQARLLALQRQLQPHFLFNTLHAVSSLLRRDPDAAESMIERLGRLLRTTLRDTHANEVTLAQDLAALDDYLAIESVQMRERLTVTFAIDAEVLDARGRCFSCSHWWKTAFGMACSRGPVAAASMCRRGAMAMISVWGCATTGLACRPPRHMAPASVLRIHVAGSSNCMAPGSRVRLLPKTTAASGSASQYRFT